MQISYEEFIKHVTPHSLHQIKVHAIPRGHRIVVQQYCNKLSLRGACTTQCATCIQKIAETVDWVNTRPEPPRDPYAFFTMAVKNSFGVRLEEAARKPAAKPETNILGERTERDGFDMFLDLLGDTHAG